ncbi:MAG: aliphatic sulfonate ABC transporter substrate-binding protein [Treponema sp.]|nr:aliphatic sulfonate ABC transporter substrate-binding protein [Treponema sp.]
MKTKFYRVLAAALLLSGLAVGCSKSKKEQITVNIGITTYPEVILAEVQGFFEEELAPLNATMNIVTFTSGPPVVEALASRSVDFGAFGDQPALQAISSGVPVKILSGITDGTESQGLVARKDSGIKSVKDLKGKKIAAPAGSSAHIVLLVFLEKEGLTLDDIQYINLDIGSITTSLITGDIDGAVAFGTVFTAPPESEGIVKVQNGFGYKRSLGVIAGRTEFTEKHPDITVAILRALQKAAKWRVDNYDESIDILAEWYGMEREPIIQLNKATITMLKIDQDAQDSILFTADTLYRYEILSEKLTAEKIFDLKFQERAGTETFPGWGSERASKYTQ